MYYTFTNLTDYNRQVTIGELVKKLVPKLVTIGLDGETIGKIIAVTTDDQPNLTEGVSMSNDKIGKL